MDLKKPTRKKKYKQIISSRVLKILLFISVLIIGTTETFIAFSKKSYYYALSYRRYRKLRSIIYKEKLKIELLKLIPSVDKKPKPLKNLTNNKYYTKTDNNNCNYCIRESYQAYESKCKTCNEGIFLQENVSTRYNSLLKREIVYVIC